MAIFNCYVSSPEGNLTFWGVTHVEAPTSPYLHRCDDALWSWVRRQSDKMRLYHHSFHWNDHICHINAGYIYIIYCFQTKPNIKFYPISQYPMMFALYPHVFPIKMLGFIPGRVCSTHNPCKQPHSISSMQSLITSDPRCLSGPLVDARESTKKTSKNMEKLGDPLKNTWEIWLTPSKKCVLWELLPPNNKGTAAKVPQMAADRIEDALLHALQPRRVGLPKG